MRILIKKIKGSALQFALLIATLIVFLLIAFILIVNTHNLFRTQSSFLQSSILESQSGIQFVLNNKVNIDSISKAEDGSLKIEEGFLGAYQMITSTSSKKNKQTTTKALIGTIHKKENRVLYLTDHNNPLVLVGNSEIQGLAYLPEKGVKAGVISGTYFNGKELVSGAIKYSTTRLPKLNKDFRAYVDGLFQKNWKSENVQQSWKTEVKNSFYRPQKILYSRDHMDYYGTSLGNIRIQSDKEVVVHKEAQLSDVLIVAPIVRIQKGFKGNIHVIAKDSIIIENNVVLDYPSSLVLSSNSIEKKDPTCVLLRENSVVNGIIMHVQKDTPEQPSANLVVSDKAVIKGQIYCEGYFEHRGLLNGSAYANHFITSEAGSYINHLLDGKMISTKASANYAGLPLETHEKTIIQWLY